MSTQSVVIFVENRTTGQHLTKPVTVNGHPHTFEKLYGTTVTANAVGVNGELPQNVTIQFGPPGHPHKFQLSNTPTVIDDQPEDISQWTITATST